MTEHSTEVVAEATQYATYEYFGDSPNRTVIQRSGDALLMMSEIGEGIFVGWETCSACLQRVKACGCSTGPAEPSYVTAWRKERWERKQRISPPRVSHGDVSNPPDLEVAESVSNGLSSAIAAVQTERELGNEDVGF